MQRPHFLVALGLVGCLDPTQIRLSLHTDVPYEAGRSATITAGGVPLPEDATPSAMTTRGWSDDGVIGTLVMIPTDDKDETVSVRVVLGVTRDPTTCRTQDADGCIIARRRLNYIAHTPLELPITLHAACIGEPCDENSTCNALGQCVPSDVDPDRCREPGQCLVPDDWVPKVPPVGVPIAAITAGHQHACALFEDGRIKCWGDNSRGQLGIGSTTSVGTDMTQMGENLHAVDLGQGRTATQVVAGGQHTCALLDDATLKCWGNNDHGQLGLGLGPDEHQGDAPGEMGDPLPAVDFGGAAVPTRLAAGFRHTCVLLDNGNVKCWGANDQGQVGFDDVLDHRDPSQDPPLILDQTLTTASRIATGHFHTCALLDGGQVKCWGDNSRGQLGIGSLVDQSMPFFVTPPTLPYGEAGLDLALGNALSCARLASDRVTCWGANSDGQLGLDDQADRLEPPSVPIDLGAGRTVSHLAAGGRESCAVLDDASLKCWGDNQYGQLGQGDTHDRGTVQFPMTGLLPVDLGLGRTTHVTVGTAFACAVLDGAMLKCWGVNDQGQLGLGDTEPRGNRTGEMGALLPAVDLGP